MTPDPSQTEQQGNPPTDSGQVSGDSTPTPPAPPAQDDTPPAGPYKVFETKEDYERQFGPTRTEGRLSLAKKYGFDTIEAFDAAVPSWKQAHDASLSEMEKIQQENQRLANENQTFKASQAAQKLAETAREAAEKFGIDPAKMDRVLELRQSNPEEITAEGEINTKLLEHSLQTFIDRNPEFKAEPVTVGDTGTNPAGAASGSMTLNEQISKAQSEGRWMDAIRLESQKLVIQS